MIPNLTQDEIARLRELIRDLNISGSNGLIVRRTGWARFAITDARPVRKPVQNGGGGEGAYFPIRVKLDPLTASLTGSATTQCQFRYFAFPFDEQTYEDAHRLDQTSRANFIARTAVGEYTPAGDTTAGMAWYDNGVLRLIAWKEVARVEACA